MTSPLVQGKWDVRFLRLAHEVAKWSKDPSTKVGCILVKDKKVISMGYNGFPAGIIHIRLLEFHPQADLCRFNSPSFLRDPRPPAAASRHLLSHHLPPRG